MNMNSFFNIEQFIAEHITGHSNIAPERKTDPGPAFDWSMLSRLLDQESQL